MTDVPARTNLHIGRMDGRLTALESRIDRHETVGRHGLRPERAETGSPWRLRFDLR